MLEEKGTSLWASNTRPAQTGTLRKREADWLLDLQTPGPGFRRGLIQPSLYQDLALPLGELYPGTGSRPATVPPLQLQASALLA